MIQLAKEGLFDVEECLSSGVFISGLPGSGKSQLAMNIAKTLAENNVVLFIVDPIQIWIKEFYPVKNHIQVQPKNLPRIDWNTHCIFDTSTLSDKEQLEFIELLCSEMRKVARSTQQEKPNRIIIFDECQTAMPDNVLQKKRGQHTKQLLTEGRNLKIRYMAITQSPATCDKLLINLAHQCYFFRGNENDMKYVRRLIGRTTGVLPDDPGWCFYKYGTKTRRIKVPMFNPSSHLTLSRHRSRVTGMTGPLLGKAMDEAVRVPIRNGRNHYDFKAYSFGEVGSFVEGELMNEIVKGLDELITNSHLKFDYIVSPRYGARWAFLVAAKRNAKVLFISERPRKLIDKLPEESIFLRTALYSKKLYFRGVKPEDKVIIIDDVISEGRTTKSIIAAFRKLEAQVLGVFCIVAKGDGYKSVQAEGVEVGYLAHEITV
jgi:adenine/guanine phosphoribosyltransferase-like PRPP-binding protein